MRLSEWSDWLPVWFNYFFKWMLSQHIDLRKTNRMINCKLIMALKNEYTFLPLLFPCYYVHETYIWNSLNLRCLNLFLQETLVITWEREERTDQCWDVNSICVGWGAFPCFQQLEYLLGQHILPSFKWSFICLQPLVLLIQETAKSGLLILEAIILIILTSLTLTSLLVVLEAMEAGTAAGLKPGNAWRGWAGDLIPKDLMTSSF